MQFFEEVLAISELLQIQAWFFVVAAFAVSFGIGWLLDKQSRTLIWAHRIAFALLPFWIYVAVFVVSPEASSGTNFAWFIAGLAIAAPFMFAWLLGYAGGALYRWRIETRTTSR